MDQDHHINHTCQS